jgi:hypothetical protein
MEDDFRPVLFKCGPELVWIANVSLDGDEVGISIIVRLKINAEAAIAAFKQHPGKNPAEKTGPAGDQNCEHVSSEYYV